MSNLTHIEPIVTFRKARKSLVPLIIGLVSPSGGGKTLSALRLAHGIQKVRGGKIVMIDTEASRGEMYAELDTHSLTTLNRTEQFDYLHANLDEPFSSKRYCQMLLLAAKEAQRGVIIIDSMSHEHDGPGGYLDYHQQEVNRMSNNEEKTGEAVSWRAWAKPAADRKLLETTMLSINCAIICCFRAREKSGIIKDNGKNKVVDLGFQAITGDSFTYLQTVRILLQPDSNGVPDWKKVNEKSGAPNQTAKLPIVLEKTIGNYKGQISEEFGMALGSWSAGNIASGNTGTSAKKPNQKENDELKAKKEKQLDSEDFSMKDLRKLALEKIADLYARKKFSALTAIGSSLSFPITNAVTKGTLDLPDTKLNALLESLDNV